MPIIADMRHGLQSAESAQTTSAAIYASSGVVTVNNGCIIEAACQNPNTASVAISPSLILNDGANLSIAKDSYGAWVLNPGTGSDALGGYKHHKIEPKDLLLSPHAGSFDLINASQSLTVTNNSTDSIDLSSLNVTVEGDDTGYYNVGNLSGTLGAGQSTSLEVSLNLDRIPTSSVIYNDAIVKITNSDGSISASAGLNLTVTYAEPSEPPVTTYAQAPTFRGRRLRTLPIPRVRLLRR